MNTFCKNEEVYNEIIGKYGGKYQVLKAIEELIELQYALKDYATKDKRIDIENLITEIADVKIILQQLQLIFNINDDVIIHEANKKFKKLGF